MTEADPTDRALSVLLLLATLVLLVDYLLWIGSGEVGGPWLPFFLHALGTLYFGIGDRLRLAVWLALVPAAVLAVCAPYLLGPSPFHPAAVASFDAALLGLLVLDMVVMRTPGRPLRRRFGLGAGGAALALGLFALAASAAPPPAPAPLGVAIVPPWQVLAPYAVLRAVPGKIMGVVAAFAFMLSPAFVAPLLVERLRRPPARLWWRLACIGLVGVVIALGWLGAQPAEPPVQWGVQALALVYVGLLVAVPLVLARWQRRREASVVEVF